jgi:hypothetical protein
MVIPWSNDTCMNVSVVAVLALLALLVIRNFVMRERFTDENDKQQ